MKRFIGRVVEIRFRFGYWDHEVKYVPVRILDVESDQSEYGHYSNGAPITEWCWAEYA